LPILVDPSHGTGKRAYVPAMSLAALAAGADGIIVEVHPEPDKAMTDGAQSLDFAGMDVMLGRLKALAPVVGRAL
jgi:3-deoxy-7-phosphoheptulonate synthase